MVRREQESGLGASRGIQQRASTPGQRDVGSNLERQDVRLDVVSEAIYRFARQPPLWGGVPGQVL